MYTFFEKLAAIGPDAPWWLQPLLGVILVVAVMVALYARRKARESEGA